MARDIDEDDDSPEPKKKAKGMPLPLILAIVAGVLVLGCGGVSVAGFFAFRATAKKPTEPTDQVRPPEQHKPNEKPIEPSSGDATPPLQMESERAIVGAYRENSLAADAKAKGKKVTFTMTVQEVGRFEGKAMIAKCTTADSYYVRDGLNGIQSIKALPTPPNFYAFAADENDPLLRSIKRGDFVIVTGYMKGRFDDGVVRGMGTKAEAFRVEVERCTYSIKPIPVPIVKIPAFSESKVEDTASWVLTRFREYKALPKGSAESKAYADTFIKNLDGLVGRRVKWEFINAQLKGPSKPKLDLLTCNASDQRLGPYNHVSIYVVSDAESGKKSFESGIEISPESYKILYPDVRGYATINPVIEGTIDRVLQKLSDSTCPVCFVLSNIKVTVRK